ncbi:hypothetical protein [Streptosporangium sp. NPDC052375]
MTDHIRSIVIWGGSRGGRPVTHDPDLYKQRNAAERCINRMKNTASTG